MRWASYLGEQDDREHAALVEQRLLLAVEQTLLELLRSDTDLEARATGARQGPWEQVVAVGSESRTLRCGDRRGRAVRDLPSTDVDVHARVDYGVFEDLSPFLVEGDPQRTAEFEARSARAVPMALDSRKGPQQRSTLVDAGSPRHDGARHASRQKRRMK